MAEGRYKLSELLKRLHIHERELKYYEINLSINRKKNEHGAPYYTQDDLKRFQHIIKLHEKGFHIKSIQSVLPYIEKVIEMDDKKREAFKHKLETALGLCGEEAKNCLRKEYKGKEPAETKPMNVRSKSTSVTVPPLNDEKTIQLREVMCSIITEALKQNNVPLVQQINDSLLPELDYRMRLIEQKEEEHYRQLDRTIREKQLVIQQAAVAKETSGKRQSKFFKKHNVHI